MNDSPHLQALKPNPERYDTHVPNPWVPENRFIDQEPDHGALPVFSKARELLPDPFWTSHASAIDCYWRAWELAFGNLKLPNLANDFAANYCDTAFNGNLFMWDSCFITCFGVLRPAGLQFPGHPG